MNMTQLELNRKLLDAITAEIIELTSIEELLKLGADPLGSSSENDPNEHILSELFCEAAHNSELSEKMPKMVQLFIDYGMNIESKNIPDDGDNINPLWDLQFNGDENGLKVLKILLDNGLDYKSAESLVEHIFTDMDMCDGCEIGDEWFLNSTICSLKMIMCVASYPHIMDKSEYIRECIEIEKNDALNLISFRSWNDYDYHIDISTCTNIPNRLQNATLTIKDKKTSKIMWSFLV